MQENNGDTDIYDFGMRIFLRYFRSRVQTIGVERPLLKKPPRNEELDLLQELWAISKPVKEFIQHILAHRHETQALLQFRKREDDAVIRGRIDARDSAIAQRVSGNPSLIVSEEPVRSFDTGANQVVAWVVHMASTHIRRLSDRVPDDSPYRTLINDSATDISTVKRLDALREPLKHVMVGRRLGPNAVREAVRSRREFYRLAGKAYTTLTEIERGDKSALKRVLSGTLMGPLQESQRFELAVAAGIGEALSDALSTEEHEEPLRLPIIPNAGSREEPVLRCGRFSIFWDSAGNSHKPSKPLVTEKPEPSEDRLKKILKAYGMDTGAARPDLRVVEEKTGNVVAIIEVKYFSSGESTKVSDYARTRFREAASQIIRYGREYCSEEEALDRLIGHSLIVLRHEAPAKQNASVATGIPCTLDFKKIQEENGLQSWVREHLLKESP